MYVLYSRGLTKEESIALARTHEYKHLTAKEFLSLLSLVKRRDLYGHTIVDNAFTERFLFRLGGVVTTVDTYRNEYDEEHNRKLSPWPLPALEHALVIEHMEFPDGQITGYQAKGEFGLLSPKLT